MTAALIVVAVLALVAVACLTAVAFRSVLTAGPELVGKTVVINTRKPDDQAIRGVLHGQHSDRWTLREAIYVSGRVERPVDGVIHVPTANIAFVQEIEA